MNLDVIELIQSHTSQKLLLEDILYILEKLEDENTFRIYSASPQMAASIGNLVESIKINLEKVLI